MEGIKKTENILIDKAADRAEEIDKTENILIN